MKGAHTNERMDLDRVLLGQPGSSGWPFLAVSMS
jgi:hypothetical protein